MSSKKNKTKDKSSNKSKKASVVEIDNPATWVLKEVSPGMWGDKWSGVATWVDKTISPATVGGKREKKPKKGKV